ncbi:HPr family phosphocarrier protein [Actinoplanes friuliensis]|uniref:Putative phosphocarrier protein HPr n=1 Tax=Actinoplanes friuliensis DSM 7358 TaxID=1246995 RepID=U5VT31_9ACTN|nr:HPr family phosphocarrier protein [Actinoplanes friuliensis]AGZ38885.1 putative phosphocarrier protein HPr [Actinoplanes friuliensis DSM 7358]
MIRTVLLGGRAGLHMRAASRIAIAAALQTVPVTVRTMDRPAVPADSVLSLLSLGALCGTELILEAWGPGAEVALDNLARLLAADLDVAGA